MLACNVSILDMPTVLVVHINNGFCCIAAKIATLCVICSVYIHSHKQLRGSQH
jgi:hypothetical protein